MPYQYWRELYDYEAKCAYEQWAEDNAYNTVIIPTYMADLDNSGLDKED